MMATCLSLPCITCPQPLIPSITTSCWHGSLPPSEGQSVMLRSLVSVLLEEHNEASDAAGRGRLQKCPVWRSAGVGPGPLLFILVHCRLDRPRRGTRSLPSPVCWPYTQMQGTCRPGCAGQLQSSLPYTDFAWLTGCGQIAYSLNTTDRDLLMCDHVSEEPSANCYYSYQSEQPAPMQHLQGFLRPSSVDPAVRTQRRRRTDTSIFSVRTRHAGIARPLRFIGPGLRNESISSRQCTLMPAWPGAVYVTSSTIFSVSPIPIVTVLSRGPLCSWRFDVHEFPLSAIVRFRWLVAASGTTCRGTSPQLQWYWSLFSANASIS